MQFIVLLATVTVLLVGLADLDEQSANDSETFQRINLELGQIGCRNSLGIFLALLHGLQGLIFFHGLTAKTIGRHRLIGSFNEAINNFVYAQFIAFDFINQRQYLGDGGRAGGNCHNHVLEAFLNALGYDDFILARE